MYCLYRTTMILKMIKIINNYLVSFLLYLNYVKNVYFKISRRVRLGHSDYIVLYHLIKIIHFPITVEYIELHHNIMLYSMFHI